MEKMTDQEQLELVREAVQELKDGRLVHFSFAIVFAHIVDPQEPTPKDLEWGAKRLEQIRDAELLRELRLDTQAAPCGWIHTYQKGMPGKRYCAHCGTPLS